MQVKATVLCENSVYGNMGALAEHGWAVWLETASGPFLFDTGLGGSIVHNADFFNIPLATANAILVSHHHGDHTGGLLATLTVMRRHSGRDSVPVHAHPDLFKDSFFEKDEGLRFVGIPHTRTALETGGAEFRLTTDWCEIAPGVSMTGEVPRRHAFEIGDLSMRHRDEHGNIVLDPVRDDQTVVIDTADGLFVVLGCSHAGLINILTYIQKKTGKTRFNTIMGGTHLGPVEPDQLERTIQELLGMDIGRFGVSHCTGPKVSARLAREFGDRFFFSSVGTVVEA